jgi:uncharacterized membrane protein YdbT with pleckstrin-like domain
MDNNNTVQQPADKQGYQTLGKKVFWLFFLQISPIALIFLVISIIFFILSFQPFLANTLLGNVQKYALGATLITFILSLLVSAISFAFAWLTYTNYLFSMAEDSFKIKRGILSKTENAIPYRQIQNVDIERSLMFQMLGLSRLIILTAGHEDESVKGSDEAEGVIPAVDQKLAEWLQTELLKRADVQKVVETK